MLSIFNLRLENNEYNYNNMTLLLSIHINMNINQYDSWANGKRFKFKSIIIA